MVGSVICRPESAFIVLHPRLSAADSPQREALGREGAGPVTLGPRRADGFRIDPRWAARPSQCSGSAEPALPGPGRAGHRVTLSVPPPPAGPRSHQNREEGGPGHHREVLHAPGQ
jgi:hypothetical protein